MRNIKFRAWDTEDSKWLFNLPAGFSIFGEMVIMGEWGNAIWRSMSDNKSNRYVLQQYTGLKDKNGVDIYEGDILNIGHEPYTSEDDNGNDTIVYELEHKSPVWWSDDATSFLINGEKHEFFGGEYDTPTLGWATYDGEYEYEVIGNIYENPDLIKEK